MDFSNLGKYATPEVLTVLGALTAAFVGWKVCAKSFSAIKGLAEKTGILGVASAILFIVGVGGTGLGTGELLCRITNSPSSPKQKGLTDEKLTALAEKCHDRDMATLLLEYARARDGQDNNDDVRILTVLVTKQLDAKSQSKEDREANNKTLVAFMDYLKDRKRAKRPEVPVSCRDSIPCSDDGTFVGLPERDSTEVAKIEAKEPVNKDSLFTIPVSLLIAGLGFGSTVSGIVCYRLKKQGSTA